MSNVLTMVIAKVLEIGKSLQEIPVESVLQAVLFNLPAVIQDLGGLADQKIEKRKEIIDGALMEFDKVIGKEKPNSFISTMPAEVSETCTDHLIEFVRLFAYNAAHLPGYFQMPEDRDKTFLDNGNLLLADVAKGLIRDQIGTPEKTEQFIRKLVPADVRLKNATETVDALCTNLELHNSAPRRYTVDRQIQALREGTIYLLKLCGAVDG